MDDYFNYNEKITTGLISEEDIFIGKYIQSIANSNTIYKIVKTDPNAIASNGDLVYELEILPTHRILDIKYFGKGSILLSNLEDTKLVKNITDGQIQKELKNFNGFLVLSYLCFYNI